MGLFDYGQKNKKKDSYDVNYTEEELDKYNLEEWQKEEVRKGFQDPWNFEDDEDEELDEDDYYYEDHRGKD